MGVAYVVIILYMRNNSHARTIRAEAGDRGTPARFWCCQCSISDIIIYLYIYIVNDKIIKIIKSL